MAKVKHLLQAKDALGKMQTVLTARGEKGLVQKIQNANGLIDRTLARVPGLKTQATPEPKKK